MNTELHKSQAVFEQLADLTQTLEKEKVQLTPEVEKYVRSHIRAVQDKLQAGQDVYESDLAFIEKVKMWVMMPKFLKEKYKNVEEMDKSGVMKGVTMSDASEARKREITPKQWVDLTHIAEVKDEQNDWIDKTFTFPGEGRVKAKEEWRITIPHKPRSIISTGLKLGNRTGLTSLPEGLEVEGGLYLSGCTGLTKLPEGLKVSGDLSLNGCTGLTMLPDNLSVGGDIRLSKNLNSRIKEDAERLKREGKIGGEIEYTR